jgi:hypothetical protein
VLVHNSFTIVQHAYIWIPGEKRVKINDLDTSLVNIEIHTISDQDGQTLVKFGEKFVVLYSNSRLASTLIKTS